MKPRNYVGQMFGLLVVSVFLTSTSFAADGVKWGGFVDGQFHFDNADNSNDGFRLHDAALYVDGTLGGGSVTVDLPFASGAAGDSAFEFATSKAQAYVSYKYDGGFWWSLGQWDTLWGRDKNDSKDYFFTETNALASALPYVHTGLLLGYNFTDEASVKFFFANDQPSGLNANPEGYDFGLQAAYAAEMFSFSLGFQYGIEKDPQVSDYLVDVVAGVELGSVDLGLGFVYAKSDVDGADAGLGFTLDGVWNASDDLGLGLRFDWASKLVSETVTVLTVPVTVTAHQVLEFSLGPNYKLTKDLTTKFDYTFSSTTAVDGGDSETGHTVNLALVYAFN